MHDRSLLVWLGTGTSIKYDGFMLVLWTKSFPFSEMMGPYKCLSYMNTMPTLVYNWWAHCWKECRVLHVIIIKFAWWNPCGCRNNLTFFGEACLEHHLLLDLNITVLKTWCTWVPLILWIHPSVTFRTHNK